MHLPASGPRDGAARTAARAWAFALALGASLALVWLSLGVGIIGRDGDRANAMYGAVLLAGAVGALVARLRSLGMARTMVAMAVVQVLVAAIAGLASLGAPHDPPLKIVLLNGFFVAMFLASAWLFRHAAPE